MRLSPANRMSRPYALREGDVVQLGVDYQGRSEGFVLNNARNLQIGCISRISKRG